MNSWCLSEMMGVLPRGWKLGHLTPIRMCSKVIYQECGPRSTTQFRRDHRRDHHDDPQNIEMRACSWLFVPRKRPHVGHFLDTNPSPQPVEATENLVRCIRVLTKHAENALSHMGTSRHSWTARLPNDSIWTVASTLYQWPPPLFHGPFYHLIPSPH